MRSSANGKRKKSEKNFLPILKESRLARRKMKKTFLQMDLIEEIGMAWPLSHG